MRAIYIDRAGRRTDALTEELQDTVRAIEARKGTIVAAVPNTGTHETLGIWLIWTEPRAT